MADDKTTGFMTACKRFFGMKTGQTLLEFRNEVGALTPADRAEMKPHLEKELVLKIDDVSKA